MTETASGQVDGAAPRIGERRIISSDGVTVLTKAHQRVAAQMIDLTGNLTGRLGSSEELCSVGKITRLVRGTRLLDQKVVHVCSYP